MDYEVNEGFVIKDDKTADWALRVIRDNEAEKDRLIRLAKEQIKDLEDQIEEINEKYNNKSSFLKNCLAEYIMTVPRKETKTQESYQLLSGSLIIKKANAKITYNEEELIAYLDSNQESDFVKVKKSVDWNAFKKKLAISYGEVINAETGELIQACSVEDVPASFDIKLNNKEEENGYSSKASAEISTE